MKSVQKVKQCQILDPLWDMDLIPEMDGTHHSKSGS